MGPAPWDGAVANPQKHAFPHLRYHAETDRCALKGVDISRVSQKLGCPGAAPSPSVHQWGQGRRHETLSEVDAGDFAAFYNDATSYYELIVRNFYWKW